jgi:hypothetical protein
MSGWSTFMDNLGFGTSSQQKQSNTDQQAAINAYSGLTPPTLTPEQAQYQQATSQSPSAVGNVSANPADVQAQQSQMSALSNLAQNGGRSAASDANLAQAQQSANSNAAGQRGAILANANARGEGGSGASLLAQLSSSQNDMNQQSQADQNILGQNQQNALQAGQGAAQIGSNMENTQYQQQANQAQAQDAINRFNAGQQTQVSGNNAQIANQAQQYNTGLEQTQYGDQYQKQQGIANASLGAANAQQAQANMGAQQAGGLFGGAIKLGATAMDDYSGGTSGGDESYGGKIPGQAKVPGNSRLNDLIRANLSPGEVVVPRSLVMGGKPSQIASYVKNPPSATEPDEVKAAKLQALQSLRRRA